MNELDNLAENEEVIRTYKGNNIASGWLIIDITTGDKIGYINESGLRTNYSE
jgi:hypothetical protein